MVLQNLTSDNGTDICVHPIHLWQKVVIGYWLLVRIRPKPCVEWIGLDSGSLLTEAAAVRSVFVLVLRPVLFWPVLVIVLDIKRQEKIRHALELPETGSSTLCAALPYS